MDYCCWQNVQNTPELCTNSLRPDPATSEDGNRPGLCLDCARFWHDIHVLVRNGDGANASLALLLLEQQERVNQLSLQLQGCHREISFLHDVGLFLQGSVGRDEVIAMALTAVTAGKGYGLNRAILLLVDEEQNRLVGYLAVGPRKPEEAWRIWQEVAEHDYSLKEMARHFLNEKMADEREKFRDLLEALTLPLDREDHLFVSTLRNRHSRHVTDLWSRPDLDWEQAHLLATNALVLVPLISGEHPIGLLLADNIVTSQAISDDDLRSLETFALPVSYAIERAALYERLRQELNRLTEAHQRLRQQQETIVRMEKLALLGELSANLAHSFRNPLTIVGGYAGQLLRELPEEGKVRAKLVTIHREIQRMEEALRYLLDYSEASQPSYDRWDINQTITSLRDARQDELTQHGIVCRLDLAAGLTSIPFDLKKMDYSLRAILDKIVATMPHGGELAIATTRDNDELRIAVSDSGSGLSPETIAAIFAPFFVDQAGAARPDMELALCARILQQQGGRLDIVNRPGGGTQYLLTLPITKEIEHGTTADCG